jgi:DNA-binding XRE family transcriptional regulator
MNACSTCGAATLRDRCIRCEVNDPEMASPAQIRGWRLRKGLTRRRLAGIIGVNEPVLRDIETVRRPYPAAVVTVADYFGATGVAW